MGGSGSGRPKKPLEQRALTAKGDGRDSGHRKVIDEVKYEIAIPGNTEGGVAFDHNTLPQAPAYLNKQGIEIWFSVWDNSPWLHPKRDFLLVAFVAQNAAFVADWSKIIETEGPTVRGMKGPEAHPLIGSIHNAQAKIVQLAGQLGLGPSARAHLGIAETKARSGIMDLQARTEAAKNVVAEPAADDDDDWGFVEEPEGVVDGEVVE